jgi:hypothetical protein
MINKDHVYGEATKEIYALVPQNEPPPCCFGLLLYFASFT